MIVSLELGADLETVRRELVGRGLWIESVARDPAGGASHLLIAPHSAAVDVGDLSRIRGVATIARAPSVHPRVDAQGGRVDVAGCVVGSDSPVWMCGPCSVESEAQINAIADRLARRGVAFLRGGAFKPRSSPYAFQGHGEVALGWMRAAADRHGMRVVTEALSEPDAATVAKYADLVQVGSRNMSNYALLKAVGKTTRPVLLKRAMSATVEEWLLAAEYLIVHGARGVVFCERGVRGFDPSTRNLLDLGAVALLSHVYGLPVVVDPSHATGRRDLVVPLARAALAAGAAGVMIETHDDPGAALSDGPQALDAAELDALLARAQGGVS